MLFYFALNIWKNNNNKIILQVNTKHKIPFVHTNNHLVVVNNNNYSNVSCIIAAIFCQLFCFGTNCKTTQYSSSNILSISRKYINVSCLVLMILSRTKFYEQSIKNGIPNWYSCRASLMSKCLSASVGTCTATLHTSPHRLNDQQN